MPSRKCRGSWRTNCTSKGTPRAIGIHTARKNSEPGRTLIRTGNGFETMLIPDKDLTALREYAEGQHRDTVLDSRGDYETGYWVGYQHALADLEQLAKRKRA